MPKGVYERTISPWNKGLKKETDLRVLNNAKSISKSSKGNPRPKGWKHTEETKYKISEGIIKAYDKIGRKKHRSYRHVGSNYEKWRKLVFDRDSFICCMCHQVGGKLQAHHIKEWSKYEELRYNIDNGVTLCVECHKSFHKSRRFKCEKIK